MTKQGENFLPVPPVVLQSLSLYVRKNSATISRNQHARIVLLLLRWHRFWRLPPSAPDQTCQRMDFGASCHRPWNSASRIVPLFHQTEEYLIWVGMAYIWRTLICHPHHNGTLKVVPVGPPSLDPGRGSPRFPQIRSVQHMSRHEIEDAARTYAIICREPESSQVWWGVLKKRRVEDNRSVCPK